jgi:proline iminopeptidase
VALFERFGGPEVGALARRRFFEVEGHPDRRLATTGLSALYAHPTRSRHGTACG